jgi:hypothetical protein
LPRIKNILKFPGNIKMVLLDINMELESNETHCYKHCYTEKTFSSTSELFSLWYHLALNYAKGVLLHAMICLEEDDRNTNDPSLYLNSCESEL